MAKLQRRLRLPEAIGVSLSVISPTVTAAFNITLVVQAAGPAAPLTFAVGALAMALVALSFMAFTHRVAHAGSAYAYITHTFGSKAGFVAGWALLLTYLGFATGMSALVGSFLSAALTDIGLDMGFGWLLISAAAMLFAWWLAYRDMRFASRLMLALEGVAVTGIVALCVLILHRVHPTWQDTLDKFHPSKDFNGWTGFGFGMAFSILSYAGFEGAATLGEETVNPRRNIPIALFGTVAGSALFFVFAAYCELTGYGPTGIKALATSPAPLNDLALRYASTPAAVALDVVAAGSCFVGVLGALAAAGRVLFALGRAGLSKKLTEIHPAHGTPAAAIAACAILILVAFLAWAPFAGAGNYYSYTSTIGVLSLILVYSAVGGAEVIEAWRERRPFAALICLAGPLLLLWVLYCNLYPVPDFPNNLWPYAALIWIIAAWAVMRYRPGITRAPVPEYQ